MSQQTHLIGRTILELDTGDLADVWSLQEEASRVFQQQAIPKLQRLFDHLIASDQVVRFDQVVVEVGTVDRRFLAEEFLSKLIVSLNQILQDTLQDAALDEPMISNARSLKSPLIKRDRRWADWEILLYFLQHGRLPWWGTPENWQTWLSRWELVMQSNTQWRIPVQRLLGTNSAAQQRLVEQFPEPFRYQLIVQMLPNWASWFTLFAQAQQLMQALGLRSSVIQQLERQAWQLLLSEIPSEYIPIQSPTILWTRSWLERLVQTYRSEVAPNVLEDHPGFIYQRLRNILETITSPERSIWLTALEQTLLMPSIDLLPGLQSDLEIWLYFLQQGHLPGGQPARNWEAWLSRWEAAIQSKMNWQEALQTLLVTNPAVHQRLIQQFPEWFRQQLIAQIQPILNTVSSSEQALWLSIIDQTIEFFAIETSDVESTEQSYSDLEVWLFFLEHGRLPQEHSSQDWLSRWEAVMQGETNWRESLQALLATNPMARQRLVDQFPESFRHQLIVQMQPLWIGWYALVEQARQLILTMNLSYDSIQHLETQAWLLLLLELASGGERLRPLPTKNWIRNWLTQLIQITTSSSIPKSIVRTTLETTIVEDLQIWLTELDAIEFNFPETALLSIQNRATSDRQSQSTLSPEEGVAGIYITQAGLVLLHPFLSFYFNAIELLEGDAFRDEIAQQSAIYLLYYLATKQTDAPEYELVFPKLLCGWALDKPVMRGVELSIAALREGEHLLQTVVSHWDVLKNTSPDGLREGFLRRQGKLTQTEEGNWKLQVEQSAIDILLSRLPWGLSMVKLPWMDNYLIVEWS